MAKQVRSVEFLPEIFQTPVNEQFLGATLDQLIQNPQFTQTQGFIGRTIGPGVNANDKYVIEPTKTRTDYQLEPGVVQIDSEDSNKIVDAITYPGMLDALQLQGAYVNNADRLFTSDYYTWDPFVDLDKFVNYAQYYWLPNGPLAVDVSSSDVPLNDRFTVTRANGAYTFSGVPGTNPDIILVRGGNYEFAVAQNQGETENFRVTNSESSNWNIDYQPNPTLTLVRGNTYVFNLVQTQNYKWFFKTEASLGTTAVYSDGVVNSGASQGLITFTVPQDAPDTLFYCNDIEFDLRGQINVVDGTPGTGPGFWIQTEPGISGRLASTPNISSRNVLGVTNNGEDLGVVTFVPPVATAQDFYYDMNSIGLVDLITDLDFDQINGVYVNDFLTTYPQGIDGIVNLENRTLVFTSQLTSPTPSNLYSLWRIQYLTDINGTYLSLQFVQDIDLNNKFTVGFGAESSSTSWFKNSDGYFTQIPLLTADKSVLYYQDGTDPEIFGRIRLIDLTNPALIIDDILGQPNYTSPNGVVFTNGMKVIFRGDVIPSSYQNHEYYVEGVGSSIRLIPVAELVTPETYVVNEQGIDGSTLDTNSPTVPDYITINRASPDLNAWTRSNRWFHIDTINACAEYNNTVPVLDNLQRARRPILEFRAGTRLFDFGTQGVVPVNIIDFSVTDALSTVNGSTAYSTDAYTLVNGSTIIFAGDTDPEVRKTIYSVKFAVPDTVVPLIDEPIIVLTPAATVLTDQTTVILDGITQQGKSYWFDGLNWLQAQQKISVNQPPLFDIYSKDGVSFGDPVVYPSTNFRGSPLFSYAIGDADPDLILGFPLTYLSLTNLGDIVFDNNFYKDSFLYTDRNTGVTVPLSTGFVREYSDRTNFTREIGWQTAVTSSLDRQQFKFVYDGSALVLDVAVNENRTVPAVQIYANGQFVTSDKYSYTVGTNTTRIEFNEPLVLDDVIEIAVLSNQVSSTAFYQVPMNLNNNPFNANSEQFTLGTIRNHYSSIAQNLIDLQGPVIGANNTRDLGNIIPYGLQILQQSSPLPLTGYFLRNSDYDIFASIAYNSNEYIKFKSQLLNAVTTFGVADYGDWTVAQLLDACVAQITAGRTNLNSFYWSDMLPTGTVFTSTSVTVTPITTSRFNLTQTYDFTQSNYLGLCVYINNQLLTRGTEYVVSTDGPTMTILAPLAVNDVVTINEYSHTYGNFVPNTPTKLGLYPKFMPRIYLDTGYVNPTLVIQGHDGSKTIAFGDIRDQVLLEFETRIYNNLKNDDNPPPLVAEDVIPGYFRNTGYTQQEVNTILGESFLTWVGANKLDYTQQTYISTNPYTYNYSEAGNRLDQQPLLGAWRGIYRWFYDTMTPATTPWEMLGFSEKPSWWQQQYGPAPYTSDNLVLWGDLESGLVKDPEAPYVLLKYRRPGLTSVIPVDDQGQLLSPFYSVMGPYNPQGFQKSWQVGDGGPVEASWWMSSSYPFAVMRLLALTRPAEFFSLFADRDLYRYSSEFDQYLYNGRYRIRPEDIQVYGNGVSKASYINWIVDYNQQFAVNSTDQLTTDLSNLDVRLCYRFASFVTQQNLRLQFEKGAPQSLNDSLTVPPESYNLLFYKNQPFNRINYSAVIVEIVDDGYSVYGYSATDPYFSILASRVSGQSQTIVAGNTSVTVPGQYSDNIVQIPYGYTFVNRAGVVDFLLSYGQYLKTQGLSFAVQENGHTLDWGQMAQEFLYFANQGWSTGTIVNLNPAATQVLSAKAQSVVDSITTYTPENLILDQNRKALDSKNLIVYRQGNLFRINPDPLGNQTISYLQLQYTDYENMVVLDNRTIFNDLIYDPVTAERQNRIGLTATTSTNWNGILNAQGFILNQPNVIEWQANRKYTKGEIVLFKNNFWQAATIVQPKEKFDYADWYKSNYDRIEQGLLQNLATKAEQLANSYNTQTANLNRDNDLLAYGLIGFRPRQYMANLNLTDTTQVNLYQQFIKTLGSKRATDLFLRGDFNPLTAQYKIYETWGIQVGTYGAQANRSWFEVSLNEALLNGNPSTIQIIEPGQSSQANQAILISDLWAESYAIPNTNILPTTLFRNTNTGLPYAGYVNVNDVDITVFNLNDPTNIAANLGIIGKGTKIWVAQDNSYNWNIYQCDQIAGRLFQITDNLNGTARASFTQTVNLAVGDLIIVRYFSDEVDGVYRVISQPTLDSVVIQYAFTNTNQTTLSGTGLVFRLQTMRVAQASDISTLPYAAQLVPGARAWVDNDGTGRWAVLEKTNPFVSTAVYSSTNPEVNSEFGYSVAQSSNHYAMIVGAPASQSGAGSVITYLTGLNDQYSENTRLTMPAADVAGYGNSVDFGDRTWAIAGARDSYSGAGYAVVLYLVPGTNDYIQTQLLTAPDNDLSSSVAFGASVKMSANERWMYIGATGANEVYAYTRVDVPEQSVTYTSNGTTFSFNYSDSIIIDFNKPDQLIVTVNNVQQVYGIDYSISSTSVTFLSPPLANNVIVIQRRTSKQLDSNTYYNIQQNTTTGSGSLAEFTVTNTRGDYLVTITGAGQNYAPGDQLTINYTQIDPTGSPANNLVITVTSVVSGGITGFTFAGSGVDNTATFDLSDTLYTATNIYSVTVTVNGQYQRPNIDYVFAGTTISFLTLPGPGDVIVADSGSQGAYWQYVSTIEASGIDANAEFGASITTDILGRQILVGAPLASADDAQGNPIANAGAVYAFDRTVVRYEIGNPSIRTYDIPTPYHSPVAVMLNNQYLTNAAEVVNGQFSISGNQVTIASSVTLNPGDFLDIETNLFKLIQKISSNPVIDESKFGASIDICSNSCSVYIGAPWDTYATGIIQAGMVQRQVNQSRIYGITTSTVANPTLVAGQTIRINLQPVSVPVAPNNTVAGLVSAINSAGINNVIATSVPDVVLVGDGSTQTFDIGNIYSNATSYTTVVYVNDVLQTQGVDYTYDNSTQILNFTVAPIAGYEIRVVSGRMTLNVINLAAALEFNKLTVLPGVTGTVFDDLGFVTYPFTQTIVSPNVTDYAYFGTSLSVNTGAVNLVIGSPNGDVYEPTFFDAGATYFDDRSTTFFDVIENAGVVYTYDYLPSSTNSINNPGKFVFGQQIYVDDMATGDQFGQSVNYRNGRLVVGAPAAELDPATTQNYGAIFVLDNANDSAVWQPIYTQQPSVDVDLINSVFSYNKILGGAQTYFDYIDPLQGKILGVARRNIDFIGAVDPASYNTGTIHNIGTSWGTEHLGEIWWDTNSVRFIDANQDNLTYASRRWGQVFPGSTIDIYQWTASPVTPNAYTGPGVPFSTTSYTVRTNVNDQGIIETIYYFWVTGISTTATQFGKTLSTTAIAAYILNPQSSGLPYIAALSTNAIALYNAANLLSGSDTILHVEYDRQVVGGTNDIHTEFKFIAAGKERDFLNDNLYLKLVDSFCGSNRTGANVPDPLLSPGMQFGVQFSPRQSMFIDRFGALQNYLTRVNRILAQYPITETRTFNLLNSQEPVPAANSGAWDFQVPNLTVLSYQNINTVPLGYRYLVDSDSTQQDRWAIYQVDASTTSGERSLNLYRVQLWDTPLYWNYVDWYQPGYNSSIQPAATVANKADLQTLSFVSAPLNSSVRVSNNGSGKFEVYVRNGIDSITGWRRVGLQDGTIAFSSVLWDYQAGGFGFDAEVFDGQYFDQAPVIETRNIIDAINFELFTGDLLIFRNECLILMFEYIYSEFESPSWLIKTSYIDVDHVIRGLLPYEQYQPDNQTFVLDYLTEVKPYHVQTLNFNLIYEGQNDYPGALTDFDVPAYWDTQAQPAQFVSPVLTPYTYSDSVVQSFVSDADRNSQIWLAWPWVNWFNNFALSMTAVTVYDTTTTYGDTPEITIGYEWEANTGYQAGQQIFYRNNLYTVISSGTTGNIAPVFVTGTGLDGTATLLYSGPAAKATALLNFLGAIVAVNVTETGSGYLSAPEIAINGVYPDYETTAVKLIPVMSNDLVRDFTTTIKYDRYQYASTIVEWQANVVYTTGEQVRYNNVVWSSNSTQNTATFIAENWTKVDAETLSGVDRTMGFYTPTVNMPGLSLPLLIDGVEYPGVQVTAPTFSQNTGYDVGNYDINVFDNISYDEYGRPSYAETILDAKYSSSFLDLYLGTRPTDINVDGGGFIDTFSSYAPEELIPGSEFDTLDLRVYTTPGSDWGHGGHGWPAANRRLVYDSTNPIVSFAGILDIPFTIVPFNVNLGIAIPAVYDWANYQLILGFPCTDGDIINLYATGVGGGNQLYINTYLGSDIGNTILVPFGYDEIYEFLIYNGEQQLVSGVDYTWAAESTNVTRVTFTSTYGPTDRINLATFGVSDDSAMLGWSLPVFQDAISDGSLSIPIVASLQGTNPANALVLSQGAMLRPPEGIMHMGDGVTTEFLLPSNGGYSQGLILDTDVTVYVNDVLVNQPTAYTVSVWDGSSNRSVIFATPPSADSKILISVRTKAQFWIVGSNLVFQPANGYTPTPGDIILIVTWNDTDEQDYLTQVFVGPGAVPGNTYDTGRMIMNPDRVIVTLNGSWLFAGLGYTVVDDTKIRITLPIGPNDVVVIYTITEMVVPGAMAFRIFQDMRGLQLTYRITPETTTTTTAPVAITDDIIYVDNAEALPQPNFANEANIWGVITIGAERILYRQRDTLNNTVSGLLRGTAGTAIIDHPVGSTVYNMSSTNLLPQEYQDYIVSNSILADGSTTIFVAEDINLLLTDITIRYDSVEVYVGGIRVTSGYSIVADNPCTVDFDSAPPSGVEVTILVRRGVTWYAPGPGTPSDGVPLQDTNTIPARFLRGLI